jgi:hypothetical protein
VTTWGLKVERGDSLDANCDAALASLEKHAELLKPLRGHHPGD